MTLPARSSSLPSVAFAGQSRWTVTRSSVATAVLTRAMFACSERAAAGAAQASNNNGRRRKLGRTEPA